MIRASLALSFPGFALQAALELPAQGVTAIFGPSGAGKTTLLRCIAGLEPAARGRLEVLGALWQDDTHTGGRIFVPTHRRPVGYLFQEASLLAHLSVRGNLEFGLRRTPAAQRKLGWDRAVELLDVGPLLERMPGGLSGGERQRVAIARAILAGPGLLLMDEPLAALDTQRKREILPFLERVQRELALPMILVSHQLEDVVRLADQLVLLHAGRVTAAGPLLQVLARLDVPLAQDEEAGVVVETLAAEHDERYHLTRLDFAGGAIFVPRDDLALGQRVRLRVRARDVSLTSSEHADSSILNRFIATVDQIAAAGNPANVIVRLDVGGTPVLARITLRSHDQLQLAVGARVWAQFKTVALMD